MRGKKKKNSTVGFEDRSTEAANNSFPRFPIKRDETKSGGSPHISHACTAAAPWTRTRHRSAPSNLPLLIHQEAEANHEWKYSNWSVLRTLNMWGGVGWGGAGVSFSNYPWQLLHDEVPFWPFIYRRASLVLQIWNVIVLII